MNHNDKNDNKHNDKHRGEHANSEHASEYDAFSANTSSDDTRPNRVVGIGSSAGGLGALRRFFENMPEDTGMAFVVIQHLSPEYDSELPQLLQENTTMSLASVNEDRITLRANHVYVISPNHRLGIEGGVLRLLERDPVSGSRSVIDVFFRALAKDVAERAVGIVLSGMGSDGSQGIRDIKEQGGITIVQTPEDAEFGDMPRNAAHLCAVDVVAPVADIPLALINLTRRERHLPFLQDPEDLTQDDSFVLDNLLKVLRDKIGHDFTSYKRSTVLRRLGRRMNVHNLDDLRDYLQLLRGSRHEQDALFRELLISVTRFFRDPDTFEYVAQTIIPELFERNTTDQPVRVWVTGCATGEEAYTLAMLLHEHNRSLSAPRKVQVFASDIDQTALDIARAGVYPRAIEVDVSRERLAYFFEARANSGTYRVKNWLREMVIFSPHNVVSDPPFARLDMISCRNMLIYFQSDLRAQVFATFHYALEPQGILLLGNAEVAPQKTFTARNRSHHIFARNEGVFALPRRTLPSPEAQPQQRPRQASQQEGSLLGVQRLILDHYLPPSVLVNDDYEVVYTVGKVGRYLELPAGKPSYNVLEMAREGLRLGLRTALMRVFQQHQDATNIILPLNTPTANDLASASPAEADNPEVGNPEADNPQASKSTPLVRVNVRRVEQTDNNATLALISFEQDVNLERVSQRVNQDDNGLLLELERELHNTHAALRNSVGEMETANEELQASNEELRSINEELQASNEELTASKEELQSTYEELTVVNQELEDKVNELEQLNDDLNNFVASTNIATVFVDAQRRLRRFTPQTTEILNLIGSDVGRPFSHISHTFKEVDLPAVVEQVFNELQPLEREVQTQDERWFIMQARPYRTADNRIDGVVISWSDITSMKREQDQLTALFDVFPDAIIRVDRTSKHLDVKPSPSVPHIDETLVGNTYEENTTPEHAATGHAKLREAFETGQVVVERYADALGAPQVLEVRTIAIDDNEAFKIVRDVSEADALERALRKKNEQFELVLEGGELAFWDWHMSQRSRIINDRWASIFGYNISEVAKRLQEGWFPPVHPEDEPSRQAIIDEHLAGKTPAIASEFRMQHKQGHWVWVRERGKVVEHDDEGNPTRAVGVLIDISPEKAAATAIQNALVEKELLLKELNHRVKNNLQMIVSMLSIQSRQIADPEMREMLLANRARVQTISLVHRELYGEDFDGYLNLETALRTISEGTASLDTAHRTKVIFSGVPVHFSIDRAIPLGLVVSELVSNTCKHAFPEWADITTPTVYVDLTQTDTTLVVVVYDNGVGIHHPRRERANPDDNPTPSMGKQLIEAFVSQLDGSISQDTPFPDDPKGCVGTRFTLHIPKQDSVKS